MDKICIKGGVPLEGVIPIGGAKNAALPLMAASLLTSETLTLKNVPVLADIATMANLLVQHGVSVIRSAEGADSGHVVELSAGHITSSTAPYDLVRKMRASVLVLGPLVARCGRARVSLPGGCAIGPRPVDLHIKGLQRLGAEVELHEGYIDARAPKGLRGAEIAFPAVSVGATENLLMAASLAEGETQLINAAREPEITDLAERLEGVDVMTEPYPGFPTDLQAQIMALMTIADGASMITETIFENRFMHVPELARMGANINVHGASALVRGVPRLMGAPVMATDLRASVSLVVAGLAAAGETVINRVYHLDRGYERLEEKLAGCNARIERVRDGA